MPGKTIGPLPLLADHFKFVGIFRYPDEIVVDNQTWRQHPGDTCRSNDDQPGFQFFVFRLVGRPGARLVTISNHRYRHESRDGNEEYSADDQSDEQGGVYGSPVGSGRCRMPGRQYVE
ncbi:hypothetical protein D9M71_522930 [compost metagenome]